jgi:hypothetical protein
MQTLVKPIPVNPILVNPILLNIFLTLLLLVISRSASATTVSQLNICQSAPVPSGWIVANKSWSKTTCGDPATAQGNVSLIERYDNLPIGMPLIVCESSPIPPGWVPTSYQWNATLCGAQFGSGSGPFNTVTINNALCTNESEKLCFPSLSQFAVIWALPSKVSIPYGQGTGSVQLGWFSLEDVCIWVKAGGATSQLWSCPGKYAVQTWPYVGVGETQTFIVSASSTSPSPELATVAVTGVEGAPPRISASPTTVTVPAGASVGSTTVSYNLAGSDYYSGMCIWVSTDGSAAQLWACGSGMTLSQVWPYVPKGGTSTFWLNPSRTSASQILASVVVTGK